MVSAAAAVRTSSAHHLADGEIAHPADVGGAADGLAAQMEAPGGERIAEDLPRHLRGDDHGDQHRRGQPQVAGRLQRDEVMVSGPPITEADSALMPITA